jgi:hypothetical protein
VIQTFDSGGKIKEKLNSRIVNSFLIFTEVSVWHMKVISVSCGVFSNVSMLSTTNDNMRAKICWLLEEY